MTQATLKSEVNFQIKNSLTIQNLAPKEVQGVTTVNLLSELFGVGLQIIASGINENKNSRILLGTATSAGSLCCLIHLHNKSKDRR